MTPEEKKAREITQKIKSKYMVIPSIEMDMQEVIAQGLREWEEERLKQAASIISKELKGGDYFDDEQEKKLSTQIFEDGMNHAFARIEAVFRKLAPKNNYEDYPSYDAHQDLFFIAEDQGFKTLKEAVEKAEEEG